MKRRTKKRRTKKRRNADPSIRKAERAAATGGPRDRLRLAKLRLRAGTQTSDDVWVAIVNDIQSLVRKKKGWRILPHWVGRTPSAPHYGWVAVAKGKSADASIDVFIRDVGVPAVELHVRPRFTGAVEAADRAFASELGSYLGAKVGPPHQVTSQNPMARGRPKKPKRNPDPKLRKLVRAAAAGDESAALRLLHEKIRAGLATPHEKLELLANRIHQELAREGMGLEHQFSGAYAKRPILFSGGFDYEHGKGLAVWGPTADGTRYYAAGFNGAGVFGWVLVLVPDRSVPILVSAGRFTAPLGDIAEERTKAFIRSVQRGAEGLGQILPREGLEWHLQSVYGLHQPGYVKPKGTGTRHPQYGGRVRLIETSGVQTNPSRRKTRGAPRTRRAPRAAGPARHRTRRKRNPLMAIWGNPPKTETADWIPINQASAYASPQDLQAAVERYKQFHEADPEGAHIVQMPDGKKKTTRKVVIALGYVPETHYLTPWESNKEGYHWVHPHPEGDEPMEVLDPSTGLTMKIPGSKTRVTDWWRD